MAVARSVVAVAATLFIVPAAAAGSRGADSATVERVVPCSQ